MISICSFLQRSFVMESGERYCLLVDKNSGLPLYYPNLYVTTQVRNRSLSNSSMESAIGAISVLLRFMDERKENLLTRLSQNNFFETHELEALSDYCQIKFSKRTIVPDKNEVFSLAELQETDEKVSFKTVYVRLTIISSYVQWLCSLVAGSSKDKNVSARIDKMIREIKSRRPAKKSRNEGLVDKGLDEKQMEILFELFRPHSDLNPFSDDSVKVRNRLIFIVLYHLGLRSGELLNIRVRDIDFTNNQIVIVRRPDEKDDTRTKQPLVKTRDRRLPLKNTLAKELHTYILNDRRLAIKPNQPDYLFVTHKSGPTKGLPISISAYQKIMAIVRSASPSLYDFTGHRLRHAWNEKFSELMDSMDDPPTEERQEEMRSYLMGWMPGSGTASTYNKRFVKRKSHFVALKLQEGKIMLPKDMSHG